MTGPKWDMDTDRGSVTLTLPTDPPVSITLDALAVEDLLTNLGRFRSIMEPPVEPPDWTPGQKFGSIVDPRWVTELESMYGHSVLHLRDPRFGWLHYVIPKETARLLGQYLMDQSEVPPPDNTPPRPN